MEDSAPLIFFESKLKVNGSISTKTGTKPSIHTTSITDTYEKVLKIHEENNIDLDLNADQYNSIMEYFDKFDENLFKKNLIKVYLEKVVCVEKLKSQFIMI